MGFFTKLIVAGAAVVGAAALLSDASPSNAAEREPPPDEEKTGKREVYMVTSEVNVLGVKISKFVHQYLAGRFGVSEGTISHWAIVVIDNERKQAIQYDLMSENVPKNRLRVRKILPGILDEWTSAQYVGETTKTDSEIVQLGEQFVSEMPTYDIVIANCETFVTKMLSALCNVRIVDESSLEAVINKAHPSIALFFSVTSFYWDVIAQVGRAHMSEISAIKKAIEQSRIAD